MAQPCEFSWQPFVDQFTDNKLAQYAAICGKDGSVWAASPGLNITKDQILHLVAGFDSNNHQFKCQGILVDIMYSRKFMVIRNDEHAILGSLGASIIYASKCKTAIIIGVSGESITPGTCTMSVDKMADYLRDLGY
jgi:profilin